MEQIRVPRVIHQLPAWHAPVRREVKPQVGGSRPQNEYLWGRFRSLTQERAPGFGFEYEQSSVTVARYVQGDEKHHNH